jgi:hypothetical protein
MANATLDVPYLLYLIALSMPLISMSYSSRKYLLLMREGVEDLVLLCPYPPITKTIPQHIKHPYPLLVLVVVSKGLKFEEVLK